VSPASKTLKSKTTKHRSTRVDLLSEYRIAINRIIPFPLATNWKHS
jgi:hypothetical protein